MMKVVIFLMGLAVGSFINAYVYRTAIRYKLMKRSFANASNDRRSYCDFCGKKLHWYENIPVISWLVQMGKSRCCKRKLPLLYPVVEIVTGLLFLQILNSKFEILNNFQIQNPNIQNIILLVVGMAIIGFLVFSAIFDLKYMILPDFSTFILIGLGVVYRLLGGGYESVYYLLLEMLTGGLAGFGFFAILHVATKGKGMGWGDVKLAVFMGVFLGLKNFVISLYLAFIGGAVVGLIMILVFGKSKKKLIPFGPFLIMATVVSWWWGDLIWQNVGKVLYW